MYDNAIDMDTAVRNIEVTEAASEVISESEVTVDPTKTCGNCYEFSPIRQVCHCPMNGTVCECKGHLPIPTDASDTGCMFWQKTN